MTRNFGVPPCVAGPKLAEPLIPNYAAKAGSLLDPRFEQNTVKIVGLGCLRSAECTGISGVRMTGEAGFAVNNVPVSKQDKRHAHTHIHMS